MDAAIHWAVGLAPNLAPMRNGHVTIDGVTYRLYGEAAEGLTGGTNGRAAADPSYRRWGLWAVRHRGAVAYLLDSLGGPATDLGHWDEPTAQRVGGYGFEAVDPVLVGLSLVAARRHTAAKAWRKERSS
jgi:hypothetical protein